MKQLSFICLLFAGVAFAACHKTANPEREVVPAPKRDNIEYKMTIVPRAENRFNDTLIVKVNNNTIISAKGTVAETYPVSGFIYVKTGDVLNIYYNPGKTTFNSTQIIDENGLAVHLDYNINNNMLFKEFNCRCITSWSDTIP
jgi:hypothetical protein